MVSSLREHIRVGAVFETGGVRPVWFDLKGDKIKITKIFYKWHEKSKSRDGIVFKFSVHDGVSVYELSFDPYDLTWLLTACEEYCKDVGEL